MQDLTFLQNLAVVMIAAALAAIVCDRLRVPRLLGFIGAGFVIGPHALPIPLVANEMTIRTLGDLGIIFLMLSLGIDFNLRKMRRVGLPALLVALLDVGVMVWLGWMVGGALGWGRVERIFLGVMICDSSTAVLARLMGESGREGGRFAEFVVGLNVVEDFLTVALIAMLNGLAIGGQMDTGAMMLRMGQLGVFLVAVIIFGLLAVPPFLKYVTRFRSDETLLLSALGLVFMTAYAAFRLQFSLAMGAFVIGSVIAEAPRAHRAITTLITPLRHMFVAVFFVSIGMMVAPNLLISCAGDILIVTAVVLLGKFVVCTVGATAVGLPPADALRVGGSMAQVCEFALIVAALGPALGITGGGLFQLAVGVAVLTTALNPLVLKLIERYAAHLSGARSPVWAGRLAFYADWLGQLAGRRVEDAVAKSVRRSLWIVFINLMLIAALFTAASFLARHVIWLNDQLPKWLGGADTVCWLAAVVVALPIYVATYRKLEAVTMVTAELSLPGSLSGRWVYTARNVLSRTLLLIAMGGVLMLTLLLSAALLPKGPVLGVLLAVIAVIVWMGWSSLVRLYASAQAALRAVRKELDAEEQEPG
ncbi:MAG: cation:proton antiporter [bacterium]